MENMEKFNAENLRGMIEAGERQSDIAKFFGISIQTVRKYLRLFEIDERQPSGRKPLIKHEEQLVSDEENLTTAEMCKRVKELLAKDPKIGKYLDRFPSKVAE